MHDPITLVGFIVTIWIGVSGFFFKLTCMAYDRWIGQRESRKFWAHMAKLKEERRRRHQRATQALCAPTYWIDGEQPLVGHE